MSTKVPSILCSISEHPPFKDIVGELISQAQTKETLTANTSLAFDFANNILVWCYQISKIKQMITHQKI
jgi:hypothetical protein